MPWYFWVMLALLVILVVVVICMVIAYRRKTPTEIRKKLEDMRAKLKEALTSLTTEQVARMKAEKRRAEKELALLEIQNKEELEKLTEKERETYEEAKENPQTGINYILDFIGDDTNPGQG